MRIRDAASIISSGRYFLTCLADHALARLDRLLSLRSLDDQRSERRATIANLTRQLEVIQDQIY